VTELCCAIICPGAVKSHLPLFPAVLGWDRVKGLPEDTIKAQSSPGKFDHPQNMKKDKREE